MAKVKNLNGTSDAKCKCGSWLDHWKKFSKQQVTYCCEKNCTNQDLVGAHVQKDGSLDSNWYIIPLCNKHNQARQTIEILDAYSLVPANKRGTCE